MNSRKLKPMDQVLGQIDQAMRVIWSKPTPIRSNPAGEAERGELTQDQRRHAAGLMRINHTGEVCAQALYLGQAAIARDTNVRDQMEQAAEEENDHLAWCNTMLEELESAPSALNPLWYAGSFAIGAAAGLAGDRWSLGFVVETERQVEAHLIEHLESLPPADERSRLVLETMREDEAKHADTAEESGGSRLPESISRLMAGTARIMKSIAYRL